MIRTDLIELSELMTFLGYTDLRSVLKWCKKHSIPFVKAGLKKYILSQNLTHIIDNQLVIFVKGDESPQEPIPNNQTESGSPIKKIASRYLEKYETYAKSKTSKKR